MIQRKGQSAFFRLLQRSQMSVGTAALPVSFGFVQGVGRQLSHSESRKTLARNRGRGREAGLMSSSGPNRLPPSKSQLAGHFPERPGPRCHQFSSLSVPVPGLPQHSCPQTAWLIVHLTRPVTAWTVPTVFTADPVPPSLHHVWPTQDKFTFQAYFF